MKLLQLADLVVVITGEFISMARNVEKVKFNCSPIAAFIFNFNFSLTGRVVPSEDSIEIDSSDEFGTETSYVRGSGTTGVRPRPSQISAGLHRCHQSVLIAQT